MFWVLRVVFFLVSMVGFICLLVWSDADLFFIKFVVLRMGFWGLER